MFTSYIPPEVRILKSAKIQAFNVPIVAPPPDGFRGGVVLGESGGDRRLRHSRYGEAVDSFAPEIKHYEKISGEYTYFGPLYNHFGHTMAEFVHRAIPSIILGAPRKFLFVAALGSYDLSYETLPLFVQQILQFLEIRKNDVLIISRHSEIESLFVCEQGSDFGGGPKDGYLNFLDAFTGQRLDQIFGSPEVSVRTYVSRTNICHGGNFLGERYIEKQLLEEGYTIMHPESMPMVDQMQMYRSSRVLVFPEGSASHGVEFFGSNALGECHLLERRWNHRDIYAHIFRNRAKSTTVLSGAFCMGSCVVDRNTGAMLDHMANAFIPTNRLLQYFRFHELARLDNFSRHEYAEIVMEDFDRHILYHRANRSRMVSDDEIATQRLILSREVVRIGL